MTLTNPAMLDTLVINEVKQHWTTMGGWESTWELLVLLDIVAAKRLVDSVESMSRHCWKYVMLVSFSGRESPSNTANTSEERNPSNY